jgi:protein transport protein SEC61 subunit gamma-like protein
MKIDVSGFVSNAVRVLKLTTKPKKEEFLAVAKITGLGIVVLGIIGYLAQTLKYVIKYLMGA